jgi:hypothetical protein
MVFGSGKAAAKHQKTLSSNVDGYYAHFFEIHPRYRVRSISGDNLIMMRR